MSLTRVTHGTGEKKRAKSWRGSPSMVYVKQEWGCFGKEDNLTPENVEPHSTFICPRGKNFQVLLQYFMIFLTSDRIIKQKNRLQRVSR